MNYITVLHSYKWMDHLVTMHLYLNFNITIYVVSLVRLLPKASWMIIVKKRAVLLLLRLSTGGARINNNKKKKSPRSSFKYMCFLKKLKFKG